VLICALMVLFIVKYRKRPGHEVQPSPSHHTGLELFWTVIPIFLVIGLFWKGYSTYLEMIVPPRNAYEVQVTGQKWNWLYTYPNGYVGAELHTEVGRPTTLIMSSEDVIHSFYVPAFRIKRDVMPGRYSKIWFEANQPGEYDVFCAEYCGTSHSTMLSKVVVHPEGEFEPWLEEASDFLSRMPPAEAGQMLYSTRGCPQCHSIDGSSGIGPTFQGLFGSEEALTTGDTVTVDENYVRESILEPQAKVTAGYDPVMPTYRGRLKDEEIGAIIEFLKTIAQ